MGPDWVGARELPEGPRAHALRADPRSNISESVCPRHVFLSVSTLEAVEHFDSVWFVISPSNLLKKKTVHIL